MRVFNVDRFNQKTFGHTSSDQYIQNGSMIKLENVKKYISRIGAPKYKRRLYPIIDAIDFAVKKFKQI